MMLPQLVGKARKLVCQRCGRKMKPKKRSAYRIREKGKEKGDIAVIAEKRRKVKKPPEPEYEPEPIEYYEEFFES
jgi:DNA-directed RNA polymerase subunit M/transcription elongation factor TFIIS